jgi:hypothetical protein
MELGFKHVPPGIQNRLGHFGFDQLATAYVTDEDCTMLFNKPGAEFVESVFSPILNLGMNRQA